MNENWNWSINKHLLGITKSLNICLHRRKNVLELLKIYFIAEKLKQNCWFHRNVDVRISQEASTKSQIEAKTILSHLQCSSDAYLLKWKPRLTNLNSHIKINHEKLEILFRSVLYYGKTRFWGRCVWQIIRKRDMERCISEEKIEGKRRRWGPLTTWASDIVKLVGGSLSGCLQRRGVLLQWPQWCNGRERI